MQEVSIGKEYLVNSRDSNGSQRKYFKDGKYYKVNTVGSEGTSEYLISLVLKHSNVDNFVMYEQCRINGREGCVSESFLKPNQVFISLDKLYRSYTYRDLSEDVYKLGNAKMRFYFLVSWFLDNLGIDLTSYLSVNLTLDLIGLNPDRHFKNLGVVCENNIYKEAPVFDNGQSLGANFIITPLDDTAEECIDKISTCTISGSPYFQYNCVDKNLFKLDFDSLYDELSSAPNSRNKEILEYQLQHLRSELYRL